MWGFLTTATVAVFGVGAAAVITDYMKDRRKLALKQQAMTADGAEASGELVARLERIEERMANLEAIVLEYERHEAFDRSLSAS